jgi:Mu-like prophage major head subunit gpT
MGTMRADISRAMYIGTKEVFKRNLKKAPNEQWKGYATIKNSNKMEEKYDSIGNLKAAHVKAEGEAVQYGKIEQAYLTTIRNETVANGLQVSMESKEDDQWAVISDAKAMELIRTMQDLREESVAAIWNEVETSVSADGKYYADDDHPLVNSASVNDNLLAGAFSIDNYKDAVNMFNAWKNHAGKRFPTSPTALLCNRDRQFYVMQMLKSANQPFEQSNTKNVVPQLKTIFSTYLSALPVHILDETIDSCVLQRRKGIQTEYDYDKRSTFNWYFNVHERYKAGMINPGFGFVTISGS